MAIPENREVEAPAVDVTQERDRPVECPFHQWREDFPIRWDNDHYVTRRELAKFLALGSATLAGANIGLAVWGSLRNPGSLKEERIGSVSRVPPGSARLFRYPTDRDPCILVHGPDGRLEAYSQVCTHLSCAVIYRADENVLFCPCHHGYFDIAEGRPIQGPPTRPLPRIRLEVRGDDIFAVGVEG